MSDQTSSSQPAFRERSLRSQKVSLCLTVNSPDNACGTGIVTQLIKDSHPTAHIHCADIAPGMVDIVKEKAQALDWVNVETAVLDAGDLKALGDGSFSHVLTNFGFSPSPNDKAGPARAAREMWRVLKEGGVTVVSTWSGEFTFFIFFAFRVGQVVVKVGR